MSNGLIRAAYLRGQIAGNAIWPRGAVCLPVSGVACSLV